MNIQRPQNRKILPDKFCESQTPIDLLVDVIVLRIMSKTEGTVRKQVFISLRSRRSALKSGTVSSIIQEGIYVRSMGNDITLPKVGLTV